MEFSAEMIAGFLGGEIVGDPKAAVSTLAKIEEGAPGALSFLANPKYEHYIYNSRSSIVIVNKSFEPTAPVPATMIKVDDAYSCFAKLLELYAANRPQKKGISERAAIDATAALGEDAYVGEFAVIGQNVKIGKNVKIYPQVCIGDNVRIGDNVTLYYGVKIYEECVLGDNVTIHAGTVIGADGFGFAPNGKGEYSKIPQLGNVVIEDNVEIGANTCIDRATMGSTRIGTGTKLDTHIGDSCMCGGQVGIAGHLHIADKVQIASQSGIAKDVTEPGGYMGSPIMSGIKFHRANAVFHKLPELSAQVRQLEKKIEQLQALQAAEE